MSSTAENQSEKEKLLFTPGPLTTSATVKQVMQRDLGSRDFKFSDIVVDIRRRLLEIGGVTDGEYAAIIMQGSGTFSLESVISSTIPRDGKLLVIINGAYGRRIAQIAKVHNIEVVTIIGPEDQLPDLDELNTTLITNKDINSVAVVHCETTTGLINPIKKIGELVKQYNVDYFVDAMSSFGAVPVNLAEFGIDYLVTSANKCIEGVPGFGIILARKDSLDQTDGYAQTYSLDLLAQLRRLEYDGQFRFTPPTHTLIAFHQALLELDAEGGVEGRAARYRSNYETLIAGMRSMGFQEYLRPEDQGYIITSFPYPDHPNFDFEEFYRRLNDRNFVIYPGKVSQADCFRIGSIGRIFPADMTSLLSAIKETLKEMDVDLTKTKIQPETPHKI
jgi:2-aminoethylphosphonate-pyruvate transaminase